MAYFAFYTRDIIILNCSWNPLSPQQVTLSDENIFRYVYPSETKGRRINIVLESNPSRLCLRLGRII